MSCDPSTSIKEKPLDFFKMSCEPSTSIKEEPHDFFQMSCDPSTIIKEEPHDFFQMSCDPSTSIKDKPLDFFKMSCEPSTSIKEEPHDFFQMSCDPSTIIKEEPHDFFQMSCDPSTSIKEEPQDFLQMSCDPSISIKEEPLSPIKRNPNGKFVGTAQKQIIINLYKNKIAENAELKIKELSKIISNATGIGQNTVQKTISDYKQNRVIKSPNKKRNRLSIKQKADDFERDVIRRKVHQFWINSEVPTLDKILKSVQSDEQITNTYSRSNLYRILKDMNFVYTKKGRNSALIERDDMNITGDTSTSNSEDDPE